MSCAACRESPGPSSTTAVARCCVGRRCRDRGRPRQEACPLSCTLECREDVGTVSPTELDEKRVDSDARVIGRTGARNSFSLNAAMGTPGNRNASRRGGGDVHVFPRGRRGVRPFPFTRARASRNALGRRSLTPKSSHPYSLRSNTSIVGLRDGVGCGFPGNALRPAASLPGFECRSRSPADERRFDTAAAIRAGDLVSA